MSTPVSVTIEATISVPSVIVQTYHQVRLILPMTGFNYTGPELVVDYDPTPGLVQTVSAGITPAHADFDEVVAAIALSVTQGATYDTPMDTVGTGDELTAEYITVFSNAMAGEPVWVYSATVSVTYDDASVVAYQTGNASVAPLNQFASAFSLVGSQPILDESLTSYAVLGEAVGVAAFLAPAAVEAEIPRLRHLSIAPDRVRENHRGRSLRHLTAYP